MRDSRPVTMREFYEEISKGNSERFAEINEFLYINAHTIYLLDEDKVNYRSTFRDKWRKEFGISLTDAQFDYVFELYQSFIKFKVIRALKIGKFDSYRLMWITLVRLEMDLQLIECVEKNIAFTKQNFRDYMNKKYSFILENVVENIEKADVPFTEDFKKLGEALLPFKAQIQKIYENFSSSNDEVIKNNIDAGKPILSYLAKNTGSEISAERRNFEPASAPAKTKTEPVTKSDSATKTEPVTKSDFATKSEPAVKSESVTKSDFATTSKSDSDAVIKFKPAIKSKPAVKDEAVINIGAPIEKKSDFDKERMIKDYELLIANYEEKIRRLERDLEEYKRQHDELMTYSAGNYDRGVKDLFHILNDKRYGKPLNFLYETFLTDQNLDANLRVILENFFMALEEMEIEPINEVKESVLADPASLKKSCDLEFDIKDLVPEKVYFKYVGWKYKDTVIEKPTLAKKND